MIEAIRAAPADDELRLVYADALEQEGQLERAELIRLQLKGGDTPRERELRSKRELTGVLGEHVIRWRFERGLVTEIEVACDVLLEHGDAMFAAAPIRSLLVYMPRERDDDDIDLEAIADELATRPWLRYLESVEIPAYNRFAKGEVARRFLCSPHLAELRILRVGGPDTALASDGAIAGIRALHVLCEASTSGDALLAAWAARAYQLAHLEMAGCGCTLESVHAIARAKWKLEQLVFAGTNYQDDMIGADGLRAIAETATLASLRKLEIETAGIDDAGLRALAASPHVRPEHISFFSNENITDDGIVALAESPVLTNVRTLNLTSTSTTVAGISRLPAHVTVIAPHCSKQ